MMYINAPGVDFQGFHLFIYEDCAYNKEKSTPGCFASRAVAQPNGCEDRERLVRSDSLPELFIMDCSARNSLCEPSTIFFNAIRVRIV